MLILHCEVLSLPCSTTQPVMFSFVQKPTKIDAKSLKVILLGKKRIMRRKAGLERLAFLGDDKFHIAFHSMFA